MRVKHSLVARALVAIAPFAVVAPLLEMLRLANDASATTVAGALALLRPEFLTGAGVALLAAAGALLARRTPRVYLAGVQAIGLGGAVIEIAAHTFLRASGRPLDWDLLRYAVSRPGETWPVVRSELDTNLLVVGGVAFAVAVIAPWLGMRAHAASAVAFPRARRAMLLAAAGAGCLALSVVPGAPRANGAPTRDAVAQIAYTAWREEPRVSGTPVAPRPAGPARVLRSGAAPLPNVVIIALESTSAGATTIHAPDLATTPFLAQLAERSLVVDRAYAVIPHTSKSLVSILCGFEPRPSVDVVEARKDGLPGRCLPALLAEHGYTTAFFQAATRRFERRATLVENMGFGHFQSGDGIAATGFERSNYFGYEDAILLEPNRAWLAANGARPFLAAYMTNAPHHEYLAPKRYGRRKLARDPAKNRYLNSVRYLDFFVRDLFRQYQELGLYENTVFVIVGDHGEGFGEHGLRLHDDVMYDEGLRVPFLVHDPRSGSRTGVIPGPASLLDVVPTVLEAAGFRADPGSFAGHSLLAPEPGRMVAAACYRRFQCLAGVRGTEKFIYYYGNQPAELFDLADDPGERRNLAPANPASVARWQAELLGWREGVHALYEARSPGRVVDHAVPGDEPEHRTGVRFGELLEFTGFDGPRRHGNRVEIAYHLQALGNVPRGYELVLRGIAGDKERIFPYVPGEGTDPLQEWGPGERKVDVHELRVPRDWRTRAFDLCLGLVHTEAGPVLAQGAGVDPRQCAFVARVEAPQAAGAAQATR